jgi:small acid-soluble spore protein F (minor alpha/beta-type SASP)
MTKKVKKDINPNENLKIESAAELGLMEKVRQLGWENLTAQETGKIGAIVKKKLKNMTRAHECSAGHKDISSGII